MIAQGYGDVRTIERRIKNMEAWLANPVLLEPDKDAEYFEIIDIDMDEIKEPLYWPARTTPTTSNPYRQSLALKSTKCSWVRA